MLTLPALAGSSGSIAGSSSNNTYTGSNDFSGASITIPKGTAEAPVIEGQIGYNTSQHSYVGGAAGADTSTFITSEFFLPTPSSPDLVCAKGGDTINTKTCPSTGATDTETPFNTTYTIPANVLQTGKNFRVTAGFFLFTPASNVQNFSAALKLSDGTGTSLLYSTYPTGMPNSASGAAAALPAGLTTSFEWTWDIVGLTAVGTGASVYTATAMPSLPGATTTTVYSHAAQPVGGVDTTADRTLKVFVTYLDLGSTCTSSSPCAGNGLQLRWLRVEAIT